MKLSDYVDINPKTQLPKGVQIPYVGMDAVTAGRRRVTANERREAKGSGAKFLPGDTLFARITPCLENGKIAQFSGTEAGLGSTEFFVLRAKQNVSDQDFVFYFALQEELRAAAEKSMTGASGRQRADVSSLREFECEFPPLPVQRRIAAILSTYDELIENNQRRIRILEDMARSLYREWFVHFRYPGHESIPLVDSPLGQIPQGWERTTFALAAVFENGDRGKNYPSGSDFVDEGIPFINAGHLVDGAVDLARMNYIVEKKFGELRSGKIRKGDLLFCLRGSPGRTARTAGLFRGAIASSLVIIRPTERANESFLYYTLSGEFGNRMATELNNGVAQPNISVGSVQKYPLLLPPIDLLREFAELIEPIWKSTEILRGQLSNLTKQRDLLLPRLLSGQVSLSDAISEAIQ